MQKGGALCSDTIWYFVLLYGKCGRRIQTQTGLNVEMSDPDRESGSDFGLAKSLRSYFTSGVLKHSRLYFDLSLFSI